MNFKFYNQSTEDLNHAFLCCSSNWLKTYLLIMNYLEHTSKCFFVVTKSILKIENEDEGAKFLTIAWSFWRRRNKLVYEDLHIHPQEAIEKALSLYVAYKDCGSMHCNRSRVAWKLLPNGYFKLNVEGIIFFN